MNTFSIRFSLLTLLFCILWKRSESCNEAVCASIVSKCLLLSVCKCDFEKDCRCCKDCASCLSFLYDECCSCVGMCPKVQHANNDLSRKSHVEDFEEQVSDLFRALTEMDDLEGRWTSFTFPVDFTVVLGPKISIKYHIQSFEKEYKIPDNATITTLNCTVAYMSKCISWERCQMSCQSMGATSMRWFHDGCCECVGEYCVNYGINESRCLYCSRNREEDDDDDDYSSEMDELDFGEDDYKKES